MLKTQWKLGDEWVQAEKLNKGKAAVTSALQRQTILVQANGKGVAFQWLGLRQETHRTSCQLRPIEKP